MSSIFSRLVRASSKPLSWGAVVFLACLIAGQMLGATAAQAQSPIAPPSIIRKPRIYSNSTVAEFEMTVDSSFSLECSLDGAAFSACSLVEVLTGLTEGTHTFQTRARYAVFVSWVESYTWSVDTTAPAAPTIAEPANGSVTLNRQPTFRGTAEPGVDVAISLDASLTIVVQADGTGAWVVSAPYSLSYGSHTFSAVATDLAGNVSPQSSTFSFTVTQPAPAASDVSGVSVPYNSSGAAIDLSGSISGVYSSVSIATPPSHGVVSVSGSVVTYAPTVGFHGPDGFTYTATGPGGVSAPARVDVQVLTPPAPTVVGVSGISVPYNSIGAAIDLSGSISGVYSSVSIATPPSHGGVSVSGSVVTYTPTAGYYGADSFTYTATGPGGVSTPATVSLTVATPPAPRISRIQPIPFPYNSSGVSIDLAAAVSGVYSSLSIVTPPSHGVASFSGSVLTYTPTAGYYGADSLTYTATGPGGLSAPVVLSLTVAAPPAPVLTPPPPATVPSGSTPTVTVELAPYASGVISGFRVAQAPTNGVAVVEGQGQTAAAYRLRYTANPGFIGQDSVSLVAEGPGGDSAPAIFSFTSLGTAPDRSVEVVSDASVTINAVEGVTGGPFTAVRVTRQPGFGTVSVNGLQLTFTPGLANGGETSFDYVIDTAFGASSPGRVTVRSKLAPQISPRAVSTPAGVPVTVRISDGAGGGPFTGASVITVAAPTSGGARIASPSTGVFDLTFTPEGAFTGRAVVTYSLSNAYSTATGTLTVTVQARPDPSQDAEVRGVATGQAAGARRFSDAQISNFQRRLESLRDGLNEASVGLSLNAAINRDEPRLDPLPNMRLLVSEDADRDGAAFPADGVFGATADSKGGQSRGRSGSPKVGLWTSGVIDWGRQDAGRARDDRFTTQGVTIGADIALSRRLIVGLGLGYGDDRTRIGDSGSASDGRGLTGALYGSWRPQPGLYLEGVAGVVNLDFDSRRWALGVGEEPDGFMLGQREGVVRFASASFGRMREGRNSSRDLYGRLAVRGVSLDAFTEVGGGHAALIWDEMEQQSLSLTLGGRWRWTTDYAHDRSLSPLLRLEWTHEFESAGEQAVRYADWAASPSYIVPLNGWSRDALRLETGLDWRIGRYSLIGGYRGMLGSASSSHGVELGLRVNW